MRGSNQIQSMATRSKASRVVDAAAIRKSLTPARGVPIGRFS